MLKHDKLKLLPTENSYFEFKCPHCKADGFKKGNWTIVPVGVAWRPDLVDNSDLKEANVDGKLMKLNEKYNKLPVLREALVMACRGLTNQNTDTLNDKQLDDLHHNTKSAIDSGQTSSSSRVSIHCNICGQYLTLVKQPSSIDLRRWYNNNHEYYMDLRRKD